MFKETYSLMQKTTGKKSLVISIVSHEYTVKLGHKGLNGTFHRVSIEYIIFLIFSHVSGLPDVWV